MQGNFSDKNSFDIPSTGSTNPEQFKVFPVDKYLQKSRGDNQTTTGRVFRFELSDVVRTVVSANG